MTVIASQPCKLVKVRGPGEGQVVLLVSSRTYRLSGYARSLKDASAAADRFTTIANRPFRSSAPLWRGRSLGFAKQR
jgi:hypothetical protein